METIALIALLSYPLQMEGAWNIALLGIALAANTLINWLLGSEAEKHLDHIESNGRAMQGLLQEMLEEQREANRILRSISAGDPQEPKGREMPILQVRKGGEA